MLIEKIALKNFRNVDLEIIPHSKLNFIIGRNSCGKSNLLDAIYMCCHGRTYKEYLTQNNVNYNCSESKFASIEIDVTNSRKYNLKLVFSANGDNESKRYILNTKPAIKRKFVYKFSTIVFAPFNINFITGMPELRRNEFDDFLSLVDLNYAIGLQDFKQVVRSRNALLKKIYENQVNKSELDYWTQKMIDLGSYLIYKRYQLISVFNPSIAKFQQGKFKGIVENLNITYVTRFDCDSIETVQEQYIEKVQENLQREIYAKQSLYGPHKDDYLIKSNDKDMKIYGSRGQQRITVFLIKLAMWDYLFKVQGEKPILLLDDIMSELDKVNRRELEDVLVDLETQTFLTAVSRSSIKHLIDDKKGYKIIKL